MSQTPRRTAQFKSKSRMLPEEDPLRPVPGTRMEELSERLLPCAPDSLFVYGMVQTSLKWKQTAAAHLIELYSTDERFENGAIVGIFYVMDESPIRIALYCFNEDTSSLRNALLKTRRIKWNVPEYAVLFVAIPENLLPLVQECLIQLDFDIKDANTICYWKTPDQVNSCNHTCPPEVRLAPLGLESVELIKSNWFDLPGAAEFITTLITHNKSMGVYLRSSGELCAFVLFSELYTLTILHTMEEHRRKGYAQLLCNAISEQLLREGVIVGATVVEGNTPSLKLFESLQFKSSPNHVFYFSGSKRKNPL